MKSAWNFFSLEKQSKATVVISLWSTLADAHRFTHRTLTEWTVSPSECPATGCCGPALWLTSSHTCAGLDCGQHLWCIWIYENQTNTQISPKHHVLTCLIVKLVMGKYYVLLFVKKKIHANKFFRAVRFKESSRRYAFERWRCSNTHWVQDWFCGPG